MQGRCHKKMVLLINNLARAKETEAKKLAYSHVGEKDFRMNMRPAKCRAPYVRQQTLLRAMILYYGKDSGRAQH